MTIVAIQHALVARKELDSDVSTIGGVAASNKVSSDGVVGNWPSRGTSRTVAQVPMEHVP